MKDQIQKMIEQSIPIASHMGISILEIDAVHSVLTMDFACNVNDKQTAFAGSIFSVCSLAGWALAMVRAKTLNFQDPWAAVTHIEGDFTRAIRSKITARAHILSGETLVSGQRNMLVVSIQIDDAFTLIAHYAVGEKK